MGNNESTLQNAKDIALRIVDILGNRNFEDNDTLQDFGMNQDIYEGKIKGREEAIELIKIGFRL